MPAAKGFTTSIQTAIYVKAGFTSPVTDFDEADAIATGSTNLLAHVREVGDASQDPNIFEFVEFGKSVQTKVSGAASLGDFTVSVAVDYSDTLHAAIALYNVGANVECVIKKVTGGTDEETIIYLRGTVSSIVQSNSSSDTAMLSMGIAFDARPATYHKT